MTTSRFVKFVYKDGVKRAINVGNVINVTQSSGVIRVKYNAPSGGGSLFAGTGLVSYDPYSEDIVFNSAAEATKLYDDLTTELK